MTISSQESGAAAGPTRRSARSTSSSRRTPSTIFVAGSRPPAGPSARPSTDDSQGVRLALMQDLARYWASDYDWRPCEARLNALPNFMTEIDGLDIHFLHIRSEHEDALPLIVTHGWPGSIIEQLKIIEPLTNPTAHGGECIGRVPSGDPVAAGTRVLRQADHHGVGSGTHRTAPGWC